MRCIAGLLAAAGSPLFPALLLRRVRVRATIKVPGKTFSGDGCSPPSAELKMERDQKKV